MRILMPRQSNLARSSDGTAMCQQSIICGEIVQTSIINVKAGYSYRGTGSDSLAERQVFIQRSCGVHGLICGSRNKQISPRIWAAEQAMLCTMLTVNGAWNLLIFIM